MAILRLLPNALHFREFQTDPVSGHYYHNTCGETALAGARVASTAKIESTADAISLMTQITREMMDAGWADRPEGATTTRNLYAYAGRNKWAIASPFVGWQDPIPSATLHPWLLQYAGIKPIVLMVTKAGYGLTAIDGGHPERGVNGHFITVLGLADEGYVTLDGDSNHATQHLDIYPWSAIEKAHVTGFLMLEMEETVAVPASWKDSGGVVTAPNNLKVISGFADFIRKNPWEEDDWPEEEEQSVASVEPLGNPAVGAGSRQIFRKSLLGWSATFNGGKCYKAWIGQELLAAYKKIADLEAQPAGDPAELAALKAQIADLAAQLAAANKQIADLTKTQVTPAIQADVDAVNALRDALRVQ